VPDSSGADLSRWIWNRIADHTWRWPNVCRPAPISGLKDDFNAANLYTPDGNPLSCPAPGPAPTCGWPKVFLLGITGLGTEVIYLRR